MAYAADEFTGYNPIASSRIRNALVMALNEAHYAPSYVVFPLEDDVINSIKFEEGLVITEKILYKVYNKLSKWFVREASRLLESFMLNLPIKSKKNVNPVLIWVLATQHKNYKNNWERHIFNKCITSAVKGKRNMLALELKQVWDEYDINLVLKDRARITDRGYQSYWNAVDKTIKFAVEMQGAKKEQEDQDRSFYNTRGRFNFRRSFGSFAPRRFYRGRKPYF